MSAPRLRPENASSIVRELEDGRWRVEVPIARSKDGKRLVYKTRHAKTKRAAESIRRDLERTRDSEGIVQSKDDPLLKDWTKHWLNELLPLANRSQKTIGGYRSVMAKHVIPVLGNTRLSEITPTDVSRLCAALARNHSQSVVASAHSALRSCFNYAVDHDRLSSNPAKRVTISKPDETEIEPLSVEDARRIIEKSGQVRNGARWAIGVSLGLRQGEVLGLLWDDIDLDAGTIRVRTALQRVTAVHGCGDRDPDAATSPQDGWPCGRKQGAKCPTPLVRGGLVLKKTKTRRAKRAIGLPESLVKALKQHREVQNLEKMMAAEQWGLRRDGTRLTNPLKRGNPEADLVFTTPTGRPIDSSDDWQAWKAFLEEVGVPEKRVHDMRHTATTLLMLQGVEYRVIQDILGWAELRMLDRYGHVLDPMRREAARRMDGLLWSESK